MRLPLQSSQHNVPSRGFGKGVSLVEMLVTLCIVGIFAGMAVPSMGNMLSQYRANSMVNALISSIHLARNEAIHRNGRVTLCKSSNGTACSSTGGYEQGWILFHDANSNALKDPDEALIQVRIFSSGDIRLYGNAPVANYVSFTGLGLPKMATGEFQAGTLTLCSAAAVPATAQQIVLGKPGNVRTYKSTLPQCGQAPDGCKATC